MKVCVVGARVIGITTAYALAKRGYEVTVVDASDSFGKGTSYANGAQLSYSYVTPLAEPAIWRQLPAYLLSSTSPLTWRPEFKLRQWTWLMQFLAACNATASRRTTAMLLELASLSRTELHKLQNRHPVAFNHRTAGKLVMISSEKAFDGAWRQIRLQADLGCEQQLLRREECVAVEPALAHAIERWVGGVFTPSEEVGNCVQFCEQLGAILMRDYAVQFVFNASVNTVRHSKGRIDAVSTPTGDITADHFVLANGVGSARLARQVGIRLPIYPLKGYSITIESDKLTARLPSVSITDQARKIVYARIGNRLRVAGRAEIIGADLHINEKSCNDLAPQARSLFFPDEPAEDSVAPWAGLRPATPTGRPIIGRTPVANLFLNCGHGALGRTLACGSAELLAADIAGKPRPIQGLSQGLAA